MTYRIGLVGEEMKKNWEKKVKEHDLEERFSRRGKEKKIEKKT